MRGEASRPLSLREGGGGVHSLSQRAKRNTQVLCFFFCFFFCYCLFTARTREKHRWGKKKKKKLASALTPAFRFFFYWRGNTLKLQRGGLRRDTDAWDGPGPELGQICPGVYRWLGVWVHSKQVVGCGPEWVMSTEGEQEREKERERESERWYSALSNI